MFRVTDDAAAHLAELLEHSDTPDDVALRLTVDGEALTLQLDGANERDKTFSHEERTVLMVDEKIAELLAECALDVEDSGEGPRLTLRNGE